MEKPFEESWFYAPLRAVGDRTALPVDEAFHMRKVLRIHPGRRVIASNGNGGAFLCETTGGKGDAIELVALEPRILEAVPPLLNLVLGLLKGKDLEEPVEGACQLNVRAVHLVTTDHTQEFRGQDHSRLVERLRAKSLVALKQAKKAWLTEIHEPIPIRLWRESHPDMKLVVAHVGADRLPEKLASDFGLVIGPEGGFSERELNWFEQEESSYWMGLGQTRIRGTHAPLLACGKMMGMGWI